MASLVSRIPAAHFAPVVFVDRKGTTYQRMPGQPRKVPKETRAALYQMILLVRETEAEMVKILVGCGVTQKRQIQHHVQRIARERGR